MKLVSPTARAQMTPSKSWLSLALSQHYVDERPAWGSPREISRGWTPTAAVEDNDRLLMAGLLGYRGDPVSERLTRIFDAGRDIEQRWIIRFKALNLWLGDDEWIPSHAIPGLMLRGKTDIRVRHPYEHDREYVVEVKSISPEGFRSLPLVTSNPDINYRALTSMVSPVSARIRRYLMQLQIYLVCRDAEEGLLLFDNKGNQDFKDFVIRRPEDRLEGLWERLRRLQRECWETQLLPPWNGAPSKSIFYQHRPNEYVPLQEMKDYMQASGVEEDQVGEF